MKRNFLFLVFAGLAIFSFTSCSKDTPDIPQTPPESIDTTSYVMWTVAGVQQTGTQLYALVTIENQAGQVVVNNKKVTLDEIQGTYKTDKILLQKGEFKLSKFIVVKSSDTAVYAAPKANTTRAAEVAKPLSFNFSLLQKGITSTPVQVLKINDTDAPAGFGYTDADFGFQHTNVLKTKTKVL